MAAINRRQKKLAEDFVAIVVTGNSSSSSSYAVAFVSAVLYNFACKQYVVTGNIGNVFLSIEQAFINLLN